MYLFPQKYKYHYLIIVFYLVLFLHEKISAQCDTIVPVWIIDLSSNPDSIWDYKAEPRNGFCCSASGTDNCIKFIVTLHPSVGGIYFGARNPGPSGSMYFVFECDSAKTFIVNEDTACVNGPGPHNITICKPGGDNPIYTIAGIGKGEISGPITVSDACFDTLFALGFNPQTITWTSVPYDSVYNLFLGCTTGCDTNIVMPNGTYPDSILYKVCGTPAGLECGGSGGGTKCDSAWVYFISSFTNTITPATPSICFGGPGVTLYANPSGGKPPYSFLWNTGATADSIMVGSGGSGIYWVQVSDASACQDIIDTIFVFEFNQPITANAGPEDSVCNSSPGINLNGSVTGVTTAIWSGGAGIFFPGSTSLNAGYLPTGAEVASGSVTLSLITTNTGSCPPDTDDVTIFFIPPPIVSAGPDDSLCEDLPFSVLIGSVTNAAGAYWTSAGTGNFSPDSTDLNATYTASPPDIAAGSVEIILTSSGSVCPPSSDTMVIFIGMNDVTVSAGPDQVLCSSIDTVFLSGTVTSSNPLIGGIWTTTGSGSFYPDSTLVNTTYIPSPSDTISPNITLTLTSTNNGNCLPVADSLTLSFLPTVSVNAGDDTLICSDVDSIILNGSFANAAGITWTTTGAGTFIPSDTVTGPVYYFDAADKYFGTVQLVVGTIGGCAPATDTISITIIPAVYAGPDQILCTDDPAANLSGTVSGAAGASWTTSGTGYFLPDDSTLSASYNISPSDSANGGVNLILSTYGGFGGCPDALDSVKITILPLTLADAGIDLAICADSSYIQLAGVISNAPGGYWTTSGTGTFLPDSLSLTPVYYFSSSDSAADTMILKITTAGGCITATDSIIVRIEPIPIASAGSGISVCATIPDGILNGAVNNATGGVWSSSGTGAFLPDDSTLTNVTYSPSAADILNGNVLIILTTYGGYSICPAGTDNLSITYTPDSIAVNAGSDITVCREDSVITLNGSMTIAAGGVWTTTGSGSFVPGDSSVITNYLIAASDKLSDSLIFILETTGNGGCLPKKDSLILYILDSMSVSVSAQKDTFCPSENGVQLSVIFQNLSQGKWSTGGDGLFSPDDSTPDVYYIFGPLDITSGSVNLLFTSTDQGICQAKKDSVTLIIIPGPTAGFTFTGTCLDDTIVFTDTSGGNLIAWNWNFNDSAPADSLQNPVHLFSNWDTFNVVLIVTSLSGCTDTAVNPVIIHPLPAASFNIPPPCVDDSAVFISTSEVPADSIISFLWNFGDGDSSLLRDPVHAYPSGGSFNVTLEVTTDAGCSDTVSDIVTSGITAGFSFTPVCENDTVVFIDSSFTNIFSHTWDFDDGAPPDTSANPVHVFLGWGAFDVQLIANGSNGCTDTLVKQVNIYPLPAAAFSSTAQCFVDSAMFTDLSAVGSGSIVSWSWDFGDSLTSSVQDPVHLYPAGGSYQVTLIVTSGYGCADTAVQDLNVSPAPVAAFTFASASNGCPPDIFIFSDSSYFDTTYTPGSITGWYWDFGDGTTDSVQIPPPHAYDTTGSYDVTLIVSADNGCYDTLLKTVTLHPLPVSDFTFNNELCVYDTAWFTNASTVAPPDTIISQNWLFGNGNSSMAVNPSHPYSAWGNYGVTLIVSSDKGCSDTMIKIIYVRPLPISAFTVSNHIVNVDEPVVLTDLSAGSTSVPDTVAIFGWLWSFGNGDSAQVQYPEYAYDTGGVFSVSLEVVNEYGCRDTASDSIIVRLPPLVPTAFSPNGDGQNDILFVEGGPYKKLEFILYNEWGEIIFTADKQANGWDGRRSGKDQPIGVYVWVVHATTEDQKFYEMWGEVTLLR
ncbi:MAG: PKD domain-containing protein [Bacteroidetes bacterium]|nr:PKD domain-containing protein [Bacteroidota bacterium]